MKKRVLTEQECADYLGVSLESLEQVINREENPLPFVRIGDELVIPPETVEWWLKKEVERSAYRHIMDIITED